MPPKSTTPVAAATADPDKVSTPKYVSPALRIASRGKSFRRAGESFTQTPDTFPAGFFTAEQVLMLKNSSAFLVVDEIDSSTGKIAPEFDPAQTQGQLIDHLAADPVGLTTILAGLGFVPKPTAAPAPVSSAAAPSAPAPAPASDATGTQGAATTEGAGA